MESDDATRPALNKEEKEAAKKKARRAYADALNAPRMAIWRQQRQIELDQKTASRLQEEVKEAAKRKADSERVEAFCKKEEAEVAGYLERYRAANAVESAAATAACLAGGVDPPAATDHAATVNVVDDTRVLQLDGRLFQPSVGTKKYVSDSKANLHDLKGC
mmetsp:Transcript_37342/g.62843  ORF Transcript_37342/g.62843 Transcript_37342/m.62843 type:complete len:162 (+) Transcript_37342:495-980(+)|eukprot:CAMPEP_0198206280 /NCGR_PEP_ID=MMETSP1445-20131203/9811_1 /TAXON_ID=36898 /ORGANISM="Pyramimonas sp., Strain CCMP2087" /LENGTH=161 /DNA_ID=CAMNT_0043878915 /DNA_START=515 /DNA_END=1003 /DNA_ORIENTATION=+